MQKKILVIKHGALGDIFMALGAFKAIRKYHQDAKVILLTTKPFISLARKMTYFDEVWYDNRSPWWDFKSTIGIYRKLHGNGKVPFDRIYDLQNSTRTQSYFKMIKSPKPEWIGNAIGASHQMPKDSWKNTHIDAYYKVLLKGTGIKDMTRAEIDWLNSDISKFKLEGDYAVFIAGCSAANSEKRWGADNFAKLNSYLKTQNIKSVLIGRDEDQDIINDIISESGLDSDNIINLINKTSFDDLAEIGRGAKVIIGVDTGPMHIISYLATPMVMIFSGKSMFDFVAPRADNVTLVRENILTDLTADRVIDSVKAQLAK
ncbi:MAG: glycosyltransferase family 9 protein [Rickettsiales bacterium]|jgi:ADP-heptose:LPS heptosyltransferase|nr:glycosyltransferase family 9 protein [Rickettsiales bacterium]